MPRTALRTLLLLALLFAGPALAGRLHLLHVNDVYRIAPESERQPGGLARLATLYERIAADGDPVLLVFGGDTLSPSLASTVFRGEQMIAAWNALGLAYAVPGNHEFDFGPELFATRIAESQFTWLASNVSLNGAPFPGTRRQALRAIGGVRVGFLGVLTPETAESSQPGPEVGFADPLASAREQARALREAGAELVVALTHQSAAADRALAADGAVDLVLGGHEHSVIAFEENGVPVLKAGADATKAAHVSIDTDAQPAVAWRLVDLDASIPLHPRLVAVAKTYADRLDAALEQPAGRAEVPLDARRLANRSHETNVGNWVADCYRAAMGADVALVNGGSIRADRTFPAGPLTRADLVAMVPFEDRLGLVRITGAQLREALEHGVGRIVEDPEAGRFPQVSGLRFSYDPGRPPGDRVLQVSVGGEPLRADAEYTLAASEYLLDGGDGYAVLEGLPALRLPGDGPAVREVLLTAAGRGALSPRREGRIQRSAGSEER